MPLMGGFNSTKNLEDKIDRLSDKIENDKSNNPRDKIIQTEEDLRNIIDKIMTETSGSNWNKDPNLAFGKQKREEIEKRLEDKKEKFPTQEFSDRLLDHTTILDLKLIVEKNKDNEEFKKIFPSIPKNVELLGVLGEHRNLIMHHEKEVKEYQKQLVLGLCGYFEDLIDNYQTGISKKVTQWNFQIYLKENEQIGVKEAQEKVKKNAEFILSKIIQKANLQTEVIVEPNKEHTFNINNNEVNVSFGNYTRGSGNEGEFFQRMNVTIQSNSYEMLKELIKIINMKFWLAEWRLPNIAIDMLHVIQTIKEQKGNIGSGSKVYQDIDNYSESAEFTIINDGDYRIWATLRGGTQIPTMIRLRFISGENKFTNIFDSFTPDVILKIIRGEMSPVQVKTIVEKACS